MSPSAQKPASSKEFSTSVGAERNKSDMRQFAGLLFAFAICVAVEPLANIAAAIGPEGTTASAGLPLAGLISGCILVFIGSVGMFTGFLGLVLDQYYKNLTLFLSVIIQLAWVPFLTDLIAVGKGARAGTLVEGGTETDNRFVGAMGMIGILTYAFVFIASFAFMVFSISAYQTGRAAERSAIYFRSRFIFYTVLLSLAGLSQLMLGSYILANFGGGPLSSPVAVAMYVVHFPEMNIFVGIIQLLTGIFGVFRRYGKCNSGKDDHRYQMALFFTWMCMLSMQIITQVAYAPEGAFAPAAPTIACLSVGLIALPAFLDYKMRTLPDVLPADYYGTPIFADSMDIDGDSTEGVDDDGVPIAADTMDVEGEETEKVISDENSDADSNV